MPIYEIKKDSISKVAETTFAKAGIREREDLQRLLREKIEIISEDILVISEEFSEWEDSKRRIDLLGLNRDDNIVVIELKRTEDGGHMELQAIRYAAMVSTMTFEKTLEVYASHLTKLGKNDDARSSILAFLDWDTENDKPFNKDVSIILVSAEFSKELTTAVLWLREREVDIRCIRIKPYDYNGLVLADVQTIIPLPEAEAYIEKIREKSTKEKIALESTRDLTRYDVTVAGQTTENMAKRHTILIVVKHLCSSGITPEMMATAIPWRSMERLFQCADGKLDAVDFDPKRYFCNTEDLIYSNGKTYAFTNQWGTRTVEAIDLLLNAFPNHGLSYQKSKSD